MIETILTKQQEAALAEFIETMVEVSAALKQLNKHMLEIELKRKELEEKKEMFLRNVFSGLAVGFLLIYIVIELVF